MVLDIYTKIAMLLDQLKTIKKMLNDDSIRPKLREKLEEDRSIVREQLKGLYFDLYKIISN